MSDETEQNPIESLLASVSFDQGWSLLDRFSILVRESGTPEERAAANFIATRLESMGIRCELHEPDLYLSIPRSASVASGKNTYDAKPPAFAASTPANGLTAPPYHLRAEPARDTEGLFEAAPDDPPPEVEGKIVVTEGFPMPASVARLEDAGAVGQVYINPGSRIHWGICTPIWGAPGDSQLSRLPKTPVAAINRPDGDRLLKSVWSGAAKITIRTELQKGWYPCLVPVARIDGRDEDFVLVHGHYDSWDVGIGDNATGDATLLELARIFHENRGLLRRSVRIAWWPGHSTGRYGGSAWYADAHALELSRRCVATVNIDSPGCWQATEYDEVPWMAEAGAVCSESIKSATGVKPRRQRPLRAGDYSFNQLGLTSFFMLLSNIPEAERKRLGFYPVGGCGGNIAWHTEKDRLDVADRANLERDLRVYATAIGRFLTDEVVPLDFRETADELSEALESYEVLVDKRFGLLPLRRELDGLRERLKKFYDDVAAAKIEPAAANETLLRLSRVLVHLGYAEGERYEHDPALPLVPIPKLARIRELAAMEEDDPERVPFLKTEIQRQINKVMALLVEASEILARAKEKALQTKEKGK